MKLYFYLSDDDINNIYISPRCPTWKQGSDGEKWWADMHEFHVCASNARNFLRAAKAKNVTRPEHLTMVQIVLGKITTDAWEAAE